MLERYISAAQRRLPQWMSWAGRKAQPPLAHGAAAPIVYTYIEPDPEDAQRPRPTRVYAFGSSSTEVLDYVFGATPRYRSYWAAGWTARGLRKKDNRAYVLRCLEGATPQDIIFLHFGVADAVFSAPYQMEKGTFFEPEPFCQEAAEGLAALVADLKAAGFHNVYSLCVAAPCLVPAPYFRKRYQFHGISVRYQAQLLRRISELSKHCCETRDISDALSDRYGVLKQKYLRQKPDHHADYCKIQKLVWKVICDIPGIPPHREVWREHLYRSGIRWAVDRRIKAKNYGALDLSQFEPDNLQRVDGALKLSPIKSSLQLAEQAEGPVLEKET